MQDTGADIARAQAALGFEPATALAAGLRAEFDWVAESAARSRRPIASAG